MKAYFNSFGSRTKLFQKFSDLFLLVSRRQFTSSLGKEHYENVNEASSAFMELSRLANRVDQRLNGLVGPIMNGLFLFDVWNIHAIERWRITHGNRVDSWIVALANIDMLNSLANYKFNHPAFINATITTGPSTVKAKSMGHPLLPFNESVKNDYELGLTSKAHIVTGSNMAGKSTFIRTVGLNIILALNGMPVCAQEFTCTVMSIASCIRITDSLEEHASYFRAELMRLETIVQLLKSGEPYIVLLDEILRGTNSDDKRMGTLAFFKKLKDYNCVAILATHDLVIGKLEEQFPGHFANYCFESELRGSQLHFDYKLRRGVSSSTNATFLMKSLGLID
jgi:DNA mismatch repair ATPase MutS